MRKPFSIAQLKRSIIGRRIKTIPAVQLVALITTLVPSDARTKGRLSRETRVEYRSYTSFPESNALQYNRIHDMRKYTILGKRLTVQRHSQSSRHIPSRIPNL